MTSPGSFSPLWEQASAMQLSLQWISASSPRFYKVKEGTLIMPANSIMRDRVLGN